jgi:hypothetical protein
MIEDAKLHVLLGGVHFLPSGSGAGAGGKVRSTGNIYKLGNWSFWATDQRTG